MPTLHLPHTPSSKRARAPRWAREAAVQALQTVMQYLARALLLFLVPALVAQASPARDGLGKPVQLHASAGSHDLWERAEVLADPSGQLGAQDVLQRLGDFSMPGRLGANLGQRSGAVWIHLPLQVRAPTPSPASVPASTPAAATPVPWVLSIDYPSLDRIDVHLIDGGVITAPVRLGDHVPMAQRPTPSRSHAVTLDLLTGHTYQLLIRVQTTGSMLVPLSLQTPAAHVLAESREQALQGLFAGAGLCLLLYSLVQWASLRESLFGWYALSLGGTTAFFAALFGFGAQHLWGGSSWLTQNGPPLFILIGVCGAFFFVLHALQVDRVSPQLARAVIACGAVAGISALLFMADVLSYTMAQTVGLALGPAPLLLVLPVAYRRLRAGDPAARWMLLGWGVYGLGVLVIVGVFRGVLPLSFWSLHAFQFASFVEMAMWMAVLGERVQAVQRHAAVVQQQQEYLRSPTHTDAQTALLNHRGLQAAMPARLAASSQRQPLALFLVDLAGFREVNDTLDPEAGDALLTSVARRLRTQLRNTDLLCRLEGDAFVFVVNYLSIDAPREAQSIGEKVLRSFDQPFSLHSKLHRVGVTIGYALAPLDDGSLGDLLKRAEAGSRAGRQSGLPCLRRSGSSAVLSGR